MSPEPIDDKYPDKLKSHSYDGIQEYDNPMPAWWLWIFGLTVIWSGVYVIGISLGFIHDYDMSLESEQAWIAEVRHAAQQDAIVVTEEVLLAALEDQDVLLEGSAHYQMYCAPCHGPQGQGGIGSNLIDDYYIHGHEPLQIYRVIEVGVLDKGMPAWGNILRPEEIVAIYAYVESLHGLDAPNPKDPEGVKVER